MKSHTFVGLIRTCVLLLLLVLLQLLREKLFITPSTDNNVCIKRHLVARTHTALKIIERINHRALLSPSNRRRGRRRALKSGPNHVIFLDIKLKHLGDLLDIKESMSSSDLSCQSKPDELAHYYVDGVLSGLF